MALYVTIEMTTCAEPAFFKRVIYSPYSIFKPGYRVEAVTTECGDKTIANIQPPIGCVAIQLPAQLLSHFASSVPQHFFRTNMS